MNKRRKSGPAESRNVKVVSFAPTDQVDEYSEIAGHFMSTIFDLRAGDYLITDESDALDFTPLDDSDTGEFWRRVESAYGVSPSDVNSGRLVKIFEAISNRRKVQ